MLGPVIMVLDGSGDAEVAIPLAVQFAQRSGVPLHLAEVPGFPNAAQPADGVSNGTPPSLAPTGLRLLAVADRCAELGTVADTVTLKGDPIPALLQHIERERASLVITVTQAPPAFRRVFSGNATDGLIRFAAAPVMVCSSRAGPERLERILVALDGSDLAEQALQSVRAFAADSEVILMQAVCSSDPCLLDGNEPLASAIPSYFKNQRRSALDYLNAIAEPMREEGFRVSVAVTEGVWPGPTIVNESIQRHVDLLAVATHGRTGLARRALGSCAADVLRLAPMPVLVAGPGVMKLGRSDQLVATHALEIRF